MDLPLEPAVGPEILTEIESGDDQLLFRSKVFVQRHLRGARLGNDPVDADRPDTVAAKQVVRDAEQTLSRAAARSSLVRVYVATSIGHSRPPGSVRLDSVQTCTYTVVPGKRSEALITSVSTTIDLRHLRYFLAVSEELHFGRAARRLHLTQPPLSHAIRRLEEELGVRLLDRTSRSVALTDAGRVFADEGRKMLAAFQRAVEEARRAGGVGTTVRIGCVPALPIERLLAYIEALRDREPDVSIRVAHLLTLEQEKRLRAATAAKR